MTREEFKSLSSPSLSTDLKMYFDRKVALTFAEREQNEKNFQVAEIVDAFMTEAIKNRQTPIKVVELGGGAHPDRYHNFFDLMLRGNGNKIDWVDVSPYMLELARNYLSNEKYRERLKIINFVLKEILVYLNDLPNDNLDLAVMKYTFDHIKNVDSLIKLLSYKLKQGGQLISTYADMSGGVPSYSTNAQFLVNGQEVAIGERVYLQDGDNYTVKFFNRSVKTGALNSFDEVGFLSGAETTKYYYSPKTIKKLAEKYGLSCQIGDWQELLSHSTQAPDVDLKQKILILSKK